MDKPNFSNIRVSVKKYWKNALRAIERDKLKTIMYPDRDWEHLIAIFVVLVLIFASASAYLYFSISNSSVSPKQGVATGGAEIEKINKMAESINKAEETFNKLMSDRQ